MEWFHGAAQHNHMVISSFWLLCKTSEKRGLKGQHEYKKKKSNRFYIKCLTPFVPLKFQKQGEVCAVRGAQVVQHKVALSSEGDHFYG